MPEPKGDAQHDEWRERFEPTYRDRRVCVTGGAGFIGSHLVEALVACGARVHVLDDMSNGFESNLAAVWKRIAFTHGSILDDAALHAAAGEAEMIFHLAAMTSVPRSIEQPALFHDVNAIGTARVLETARVGRAARIVFASSSSVYGDQRGEVKVESMCPDPRSPYAAGKRAGELLMQAYAHCYDLSCLALRYFNIFGPRQRADSPYSAVIPKFVDAYARNGPVDMYGDGSQTRDFTHVANAVHANMLAGASSQQFKGDIINVACGGGTSVMQLAQQIAALMGVEGRFRLAPPRPGEVKHSRASVDKAGQVLGYEPIVDFQSGLHETVKTLRSQQAAVSEPGRARRG